MVLQVVKMKAALGERECVCVCALGVLVMWSSKSRG